MAEGILKNLDANLEVFSAGTNPAKEVHPFAIKVLQEIGIDISKQKPKHLNQFLNENFDYVITVCDHAQESCPVFTGRVQHRLHISFDDPAFAEGTEGEILDKFRQVRDQIKTKFIEFYQKIKKGDSNANIRFKRV